MPQEREPMGSPRAPIRWRMRLLAAPASGAPMPPDHPQASANLRIGAVRARLPAPSRFPVSGDALDFDPDFYFHAPVAQLDRALGCGPGGRTFESCRARQIPLPRWCVASAGSGASGPPAPVGAEGVPGRASSRGRGTSRRPRPPCGSSLLHLRTFRTPPTAAATPPLQNVLKRSWAEGLRLLHRTVPREVRLSLCQRFEQGHGRSPAVVGFELHHHKRPSRP